MGGSQLSQLKNAINSAGLNTNARQKSSKSKAGAQKAKKTRNYDTEARKNKLEAISQSLNAFDNQSSKRKHEIVNARPVKGATGKPLKSRQAGIENRKKTLLPQYLNRNHAGGVLDRRFGETDATLTPEERALQRYTFERQRQASKTSVFNLGDDDDNEGTNLTHFGQNLDELRQPLADQEAFFQKSRTQPTFAEPQAGPSDDRDRRKRSRAEVMEEVMAKSKAYKYERQKVRTEDEDLRLELDDELAGIRGLLGPAQKRRSPSPDSEMRGKVPSPVPQASTSKQTNPSTTTQPAPSASISPSRHQGMEIDRDLLASLIGNADSEGEGEEMDEDATLGDTRSSTGARQPETADPYDRYVRELAFDKRAAPTDKLKTAEQIAMEQAQALERSERARLQRMREDGDEENIDGDSTHHKKKQRRGAPQGDDLGEDDFLDGDEQNDFRLGAGLQAETAGGDTGGQEIDVSSEGDASEGESESEEEDEDEAESEAESAHDAAETELLADILHRDVEAREAADQRRDIIGQKKAGKPTSRDASSSEVPYTFPCPEDHATFWELVSGFTAEQTSLAIERIRVLHHPSLAEGNKKKLAVFLGVLIDHLIYSSQTSTSLSDSSSLISHILALAQSFPLSAASYCIAKLKLMQQNLLYGIRTASTDAAAKIWPGPGELSLLRFIGILWSTSDFNHPVAGPALLLIAQYLAQSRIRTPQDIVSGLYLVTLTLQYEDFSKRFIPEAHRFLAQSMRMLYGKKVSTPRDGTAELSAWLSSSLADDAEGEQVLRIYAEEQSRSSCALIAVKLMQRMCNMHAGIASFIELYDPVLRDVAAISIDTLPLAHQKPVGQLHESLSRMLKIAREARRPLALQQHKPVPIPSFIPKFEAGYAPGRRFDPDSERNEAQKLGALVEKEKKGAIRELRKDSRFIAGEKAKMQREKDREYKSKIDKITAGLQEERGEEKRFARIKEKEKARDKQRSGAGGGKRK